MREFTERFQVQVPVKIDAIRPAMRKSFPEQFNSLLLFAKE